MLDELDSTTLLVSSDKGKNERFVLLTEKAKSLVTKFEPGKYSHSAMYVSTNNVIQT